MSTDFTASLVQVPAHINDYDRISGSNYSITDQSRPKVACRIKQSHLKIYLHNNFHRARFGLVEQKS